MNSVLTFYNFKIGQTKLVRSNRVFTTLRQIYQCCCYTLVKKARVFVNLKGIFYNYEVQRSELVYNTLTVPDEISCF